MLTKTINSFYFSLGKSIGNQENKLGLSNCMILPDGSRMPAIKKGKRDKHHPYLISDTEITYLLDLFRFEDKSTFMKEGIMGTFKPNPDQNSDRMLWGHINWDNMFNLLISELSKLDKSTKLGSIFEETLIDDVGYALVKYEGLHKAYAKEYIFKEARDRITKAAINRVHLHHGSELFKEIFLEEFKGETVSKFDEKFVSVVKKYLNKRKPNDSSLGLKAYNCHKNISGFTALLQSDIKFQYSDMHKNEISEQSKLLKNYIQYYEKELHDLEQYQKEFDNLVSDDKSEKPSISEQIYKLNELS